MTLSTAGAKLRSVPALAWLVLIMLGSFASLVAASLAVKQPIVFRDELVYSEAAKQVGLGMYASSGDPYAYGGLFPLVFAPFYAVFDATSAYVGVKVLNAALFSACAVPAYLLARRVVRPSLALGVAALTVLLPSRAYTYLVLTETLAFLTFLVAVLAIVRSLERPTTTRQLVALATCGVAVEARLQNLVLLAAYPVAILGLAVLDRRNGTAVRRTLRSYLPTWLVLCAGILAVGLWSAAQARSPGDALGPYSVLTGGYDVTQTIVWLRNHISVLGLMFAVIPIATLPVALHACLRKDAPRARTAIGITALVLIVAMLLQVAVFSSTPYGLGRMHERYLYYLAPLLFVLLALWIELGAPHRTAVLAVAGVTALLPLLLPVHGVGNNAIDGPALYAVGFDPDRPSGRADAGLAQFVPFGSFHVVAVLLSAYLVAVLLVVRARFAMLLIPIVAGYLLLVDVRLDDAYAQESSRFSLAATDNRPGRPANWIERDLGRGQPVTFLSIAPAERCPRYDDQIKSVDARYWRTEFFNTNIADVLAIGPGPDAGVHVEAARLDPSGTVVADRPVGSRYVVVDERVHLRGERLDDDPATSLALWEVDGAPDVQGGENEDQLRVLVCRPAS